MKVAGQPGASSAAYSSSPTFRRSNLCSRSEEKHSGVATLTLAFSSKRPRHNWQQSTSPHSRERDAGGPNKGLGKQNSIRSISFSSSNRFFLFCSCLSASSPPSPCVLCSSSYPAGRFQFPGRLALPYHFLKYRLCHFRDSCLALPCLSSYHLVSLTPSEVDLHSTLSGACLCLRFGLEPPS